MDTVKSPNKKWLGIAIILLTLITAVNHIFIGTFLLSKSDTQVMGILFILSALGFGVLLAGVMTPYVPILSAHKPLTHNLLMLFSAFLIVAYIVSLFFTDEEIMPAAIITKIDEVLLIVATYAHLKRLA